MSKDGKKSERNQLHVIAVFAHPDDAEVKMGGTAAKFVQMGHAVKFVSLTNGDAGHHLEGGGPLARRRAAEAQKAAEILGIDEYKILDNHDAELIPSLHIRHQVIREIRNWNADIVIGLRPNDYHPDHRYAGILVMDSAFLVMVPNVVPETPSMDKNPLFLYMEDGFRKPNPFTPDIAVAVDDTFETKINALDAHKSQFYEWLPRIVGIDEEVPVNPEERKKWLIKWLDNWNSHMDYLQDDVNTSLENWYGAEKAGKTTRIESFEIAEYGYQPSREEIKEFFPMLNE
jgi:LmbE family N-acetylglucosaminyl deacetylase